MSPEKRKKVDYLIEFYSNLNYEPLRIMEILDKKGLLFEYEKRKKEDDINKHDSV